LSAVSMQKEDIKILEVFEFWLWRKIMRIKWTELKMNAEVLEMMLEKRILMKTVRERQTRIEEWNGKQECTERRYQEDQERSYLIG